MSSQTGTPCFLFSADIVIPVKELNGLRRGWLFHELLQFSPVNTMGGGECLTAWLYLFLTGLPWLSSEAAQLLAKQSRPQMMDYGLKLAENLLKGVAASPRLAGTPTFCFADTRAATWTGYVGWLSLETGENLTALPVTPLESIAYNLAELFRRNYLRCKAAQDAGTGKYANHRGVSLGLD